ncbi:MAG TPA: hypothetical protein VKN99_09200 [Polyangia bacterium]|nr:hypothetical protein [Polyangia bacterium]
MPRDELHRLLDALDPDTRARWEEYLAEIDAEVRERGPQAAREHLEAALRHLLAVGWAVHLCYSGDEAQQVMAPLGEAASAVEYAKNALAEVPKKPEWSQ